MSAHFVDVSRLARAARLAVGHGCGPVTPAWLDSTRVGRRRPDARSDRTAAVINDTCATVCGCHRPERAWKWHNSWPQLGQIHYGGRPLPYRGSARVCWMARDVLLLREASPRRVCV